jgi:hypothetical protein
MTQGKRGWTGKKWSRRWAAENHNEVQRLLDQGLNSNQIKKHFGFKSHSIITNTIKWYKLRVSGQTPARFGGIQISVPLGAKITVGSNDQLPTPTLLPPLDQLSETEKILNDISPHFAPQPHIVVPRDIGLCIPSKREVADFFVDKKIGSSNWRQMNQIADELRKLRSDSLYSQRTARFDFGDITSLSFICLSDLHALSYGTDHSLLSKIIDEILITPNLYIALIGDLIQMAIRMRSVTEMGDNILPPEMQMMWLESFLAEIENRVLFCTWDNHAVEREEQLSGVSSFRRLASRKLVYFDGVGSADIRVGREVYKVAVSHKMRGRSAMNPVNAQVKWGRNEAPDREIILAGDTHIPGVLYYTEGGMKKLAANCGSTQTESEYALRYFTNITHADFPVVTLRGDRHAAFGDRTLADFRDRISFVRETKPVNEVLGSNGSQDPDPDEDLDTTVSAISRA